MRFEASLVLDFENVFGKPSLSPAVVEASRPIKVWTVEGSRLKVTKTEAMYINL
jgi:hypothetical protein